MTREGSGNFLTETYLSLRRLENSVLKELNGTQIVLGEIHNPIKVSINQFYGIEINDFAVSVAKTALWIAESQMMKETEDIVNIDLDFLPLKSYINITEGNALRIDWNDVISNWQVNYIMGNPPFVGARLMNVSQKEDMKLVFEGTKKIGNLDYVSAWYKKASRYINGTDIECAFVSTNSIVQGEQVEILWEPLIKQYGMNIIFAYHTFIWNNEASTKAHVHCVIVGFSQVDRQKKYIYNGDGSVKKVVNHLNGYLLEGPDIFVTSRREPLADVPHMIFGNQPNDGGNLLLSSEEKEEMIHKFPQTEKYIRKFIGSRELINNKERYCLWITPQESRDALKIHPIKQRIERVIETRLSSKRKVTQQLADIPYSFGYVSQPKNGSYIAVPGASSEKRKYIPMGFMNYTTVASNALQIVPNADIYEFGVLTSNVHMAWMRTVAGRIKSDYRYSINIVYNNFPWPKLSDKDKNKIEKTAQEILLARQLYPDWSFADLYNELTMPPELRKAHQENDKAVMEAYGFDWRHMTEAECVGELMKLYQKLTK